MPPLLTLRELDTQETEDKPLLERFDLCRHDVLRVSSSPILHDCIAVTTKGGFVELINIGTGAFRLFLTHLGQTPLDSPLRCFSLAPAFYAARGGHHLFYSLAYSNELLLADLEHGTVNVFATFHSRPSVVFCDGDHIVCGDGCGQMALWRARHDAEDSGPMWRRSVFGDTVVCIFVQRDYVFCSSADYYSYVLALTSGEIVAVLPQESTPAIALQPVIGSQLSRGLTMLCLPSVLFVYAPLLCEASPDGAAVVDAEWSCTGLLRLDVQVSCASGCAGFAAFGTASGVVLLMSVDAASGAVVERVRFDVGFSVVGIQLFTNGMMVVVTSSGDVWKWALDDLLQQDGVEAEEEEEEAENTMVPQPHMRSPEAVLETTDKDGMVKSDGEEIVVEIDGDASSSASLVLPAACHSLGVEEEENMPVSCGEGSDAGTATPTAERADVLFSKPDDSNNNTPHIPATTAPATGAAHVVTGVDANISDGDCHDSLNGDEDSGCPSEHFFQASSISIVAGTVGAADTVRSAGFAPSHRSLNTEPLDSASHTVADPAVVCRDGIQAQRGGVLVAEAPAAKEAHVGPRSPIPPTSSSALQEVLQRTELGPPAVIGRLRKGTRMDPRKARHIIENSHPDPEELPLPESQCSKILADHRQALEGATFDYEEYISAHPLKVEALKYRYPVKLPVHGLHAQVFAVAEPRLQDCPDANIEDAKGTNTVKQQQQRQQPMVDDLMNATFQNFTRRKDTALEAERRRGGPDIWRHLCDGLLFSPLDPSATVLFQETRAQPGAPNAVLLPVPLPPTPSVF